MINMKGIDIASTMFKFRGSYKGFPSEGSSGDVICNEDGNTYVYFDNDWHELTLVGLDEHTEISRKIVTHCRCCGGPLPWLSTEDMNRGHVKCSYCGSIINIFEDEELQNNV